jgi:hypothetical protein
MQEGAKIVSENRCAALIILMKPNKIPFAASRRSLNAWRSVWQTNMPKVEIHRTCNMISPNSLHVARHVSARFLITNTYAQLGIRTEALVGSLPRYVVIHKKNPKDKVIRQPPAGPKWISIQGLSPSNTHPNTIKGPASK